METAVIVKVAVSAAPYSIDKPYDYFVINDTVENAVRELDAIMTAEHCKPKERMEIISGR